MSLRDLMAGVRTLRRFSEALERRSAPASTPLNGVIDMRQVAPGVYVPRERPQQQTPSRALLQLEQGIDTLRKVRRDVRNKLRAAQREANANRTRKR